MADVTELTVDFVMLEKNTAERMMRLAEIGRLAMAWFDVHKAAWLEHEFRGATDAWVKKALAERDALDKLSGECAAERGRD